MTPPLRLRCPAKLNLGLEVVGTQADGFHEIRTLFQAIDLTDELWIEPLPGSELIVETQGADLPPGRGNLVHRAAEALRALSGAGAGARIRLQKRVPVGAGLGGGSSDAAMTLLGLDLFWGTGLGVRGLAPVAEELGSDVPYFLHGGLCLGLGRGERLLPVDIGSVSRADYLVVCPPVSLSTAQVYADWDLTLTSPAKDSRLRRFIDSTLSGGEAWDLLANDLEGVAVQRVAVIATLKAALAECGARAALMSGSGPSVFGVFLEPLKAEETARRLSAEGHRVFRCRALGRAEYRDFIGLPE